MSSKFFATLCVAILLACGCKAIATNPLVTATTSAASSPSLHWVRYTDSAEGAFSAACHQPRHRADSRRLRSISSADAGLPSAARSSNEPASSPL